MDSSVSRDAGFARPDVDTSGQDRTATNTNWLEDELRVLGVPEFGLDQWLRHFMEDAVATDMTDEKLLNFFCLARDKALSDDPDFIDILTRTEATLLGRMPDRMTATGVDVEETGYEPDEHADAMEALCSGELTDSQLVELFDLSATLRAEPEVGHMWQAVMYLSRVQILQRMKHARQRKAADDDELQEGDLRIETSPFRPGSGEPVTGPKTSSVVSQEEYPLVALPVIPWMTHAYEVAELAFREDMPDGQLLDLLQLADWMRNYEHNCQTQDGWDSMRRDAANMIMRRLLGKDCAPLSDRWPYDTRSWKMNEFRDAEHRLTTQDAATLVHLYIQTGENAYLCAREPLQDEWEVVGAHCRSEILRRIGAAASASKQMVVNGSPTEDIDEPGTDDGDGDDTQEDDQGLEFVSTREALRIAEETFRPGISDAQLLELYVLVEDHNNPDEDVFDEIAEAVSKLMFERLRRGSPDPKFERYEPSFDYPDHGKQALKAVLKGNLPHKNLLMLYRLCWNRDRGDPVWLAVHDLCRGQLLDRMNASGGRGDRDYGDWKLLQLTQRVQAYR